MIRAGGGEDYVERPMPVEAAVFWTPVGEPAADPTYPIMITQGALAAVHANLPTRSEGAASLGFLIGRVYVSPATRIPYIIVESTIDMPWSISGDHLKPALLQGREIALHEVQKTGAQLLGWYHCHTASHARLSLADVEAHLACFEQPWHVALVVAREGDVVGGIFRPGSDGARSNAYLPFYELPEPGVLVPGGGRVTGLAWANYRAQALGALPQRLGQLPGPTAPRVFLPDNPELDDVEAGPLALPAPAPRPFRNTALARVSTFWALGLVALAALFGAYRALASGRSSGAAAVAVSAAGKPERVPRLADSAAFAVAAFDLRARLFDGRKMVCADLARGLVEVEHRWTEYSAARGGSIGGAGTFDTAQGAGERRLHADVSGVEERFARTGCPRP